MPTKRQAAAAPFTEVAVASEMEAGRILRRRGFTCPSPGALWRRATRRHRWLAQAVRCMGYWKVQIWTRD
jgi:hypothetical protein